MAAEKDIIIRILGGERNEYRYLVEKYQQMVFRTCMGFVHDEDEAQDLTQEVFIQAYQSLGKFRQDSAFSTWLYRIAVNASLNHVRKNTGNSLFQRLDRFFGTERTEIPEMNITDKETPESIIISDEHREWVRKAVSSLPDNQRTAIVLSKYDDLSQKEIAEIMDISEGAVESLLQRAKYNLRSKLVSGYRNSGRQPKEK